MSSKGIEPEGRSPGSHVVISRARRARLIRWTNMMKILVGCKASKDTLLSTLPSCSVSFLSMPLRLLIFSADRAFLSIVESETRNKNLVSKESSQYMRSLIESLKDDEEKLKRAIKDSTTAALVLALLLFRS
jgi:hypothetical protein